MKTLDYDFIYGSKIVVEFLKVNNHKLKQIYLASENKIIIDLAKKNNIKYLIKDKTYLDTISNNSKHQGVVVIIEQWNYIELNDLIKISKAKPNPMIVMLDQIEDPHNFGAIIRSCALVNVDGIIILKHRQVNLNSTVAKVSSGGLNHLPICRINNLSNAVSTLKNNGYWIYSTNLNEKAVDFRTLCYDTPIVLIVGNEATGVSQKLNATADFNITIDTNQIIDSFNVSVASAILIYGIKSLQKDI